MENKKEEKGNEYKFPVNIFPPVFPSSVYHSTPSYRQNSYMVYHSHPENQTAQTNSHTVA